MAKEMLGNFHTRDHIKRDLMQVPILMNGWIMSFWTITPKERTGNGGFMEMDVKDGLLLIGIQLTTQTIKACGSMI